MPQFVIERDIPGAGQWSNAQIQEVSMQSLGVLNELGPKIRWIHSYVTDDKLYCVYLAPDEATIVEAARRTLWRRPDTGTNGAGGRPIYAGTGDAEDGRRNGGRRQSSVTQERR